MAPRFRQIVRMGSYFDTIFRGDLMRGFLDLDFCASDDVKVTTLCG